MNEKLPVHGFVLAGGKSSRMGTDKALLQLCARPMIELAVEKLQSFCALVSIAGNRDDLNDFAPVVRESREGIGPAAGIEAGLRASRCEWTLFVPVDVPLVPAKLLRAWAAFLSGDENQDETGNVVSAGSFLRISQGKENLRQPSFCMLHRTCLPVIEDAVERGVRRLEDLLHAINHRFGVEALRVCDAAQFVPQEEAPSDLAMEPALAMERWFWNINTPNDLAMAEAWLKSI